MKTSQSPRIKLLFNILIIVMVCVTLLPLIMMLINSFKTRLEITRNPLALPENFSFNNYVAAWKQGGIPSAALNSMMIAAGTLVLTLSTSCMIAYALAKKGFRYWKQTSVYLLVCNTIPKQLFIIPLFFILQKAGLINSRVALMFIYTAIYTPFAVFLLRTYFMGINKDIEDSARIDGATASQIFLRIVIPLVQPGVLTVSLIVGLWCWNEFLFAVTFLQIESVSTVAVRFYSFTSRYVTEWGNMMAYAMTVTLPIIVFFMFLQNKFIDGMTAGSVKG